MASFSCTLLSLLIHYPISTKYQVIEYFRYVNNIFIIHDERETTTDETLTEFNKQTANTKLFSKKDQH
jgi:hypothetical protein